MNGQLTNYNTGLAPLVMKGLFRFARWAYNNPQRARELGTSARRSVGMIQNAGARVISGAFRRSRYQRLRGALPGARSRVRQKYYIRPGGTGRRGFINRGGGGRRGMKKKYGKRFTKKTSHKGMLSKLWRSMHTPQITNFHQGGTLTADGNGVRTWYALALNTRTDYANMVQRRPDSTFFYDTGSLGTNQSIQPWGIAKAVHFTGGYINFQFQNRSNWDMHLKLYTILARRDMTTPALGANFVAFTSAFKAQYFSGSDVPTINRDIKYPTFAGGADALAATYQNVNYTPYQSSLLCQDFKIIGCKKIKLAMNEYGYFRVRFGRKRFDSAHYDTNTSDVILGKWTKILLVSWIGGPVDTGHIAGGSVSTSNPSLGVQFDKRMKFYFERDANNKVTTASSNANPVGSNPFVNDAMNFQGFASAGAVYVAPAVVTVQNVGGTGHEDGLDINEDTVT